MEVLKIDKKTIAIGIGSILIVNLGIWYLFGPRTDVSDVGSGIDRIAGDLQSAKEQQQRAAESIGAIERGLESSTKSVDNIEHGVDSAKESVDSAADRIDESEKITGSSEQLIERGESILATIRQRGKK